MSQQLPRTVEEAIELYLRERARDSAMLPISDRHEVLRWFFDKGKMAGIQDATKHIVPPERRTPKGRRQVLCDACGKYATVKSSMRGAVVGNHRNRSGAPCPSSMGLVRDVAKEARP